MSAAQGRRALNLGLQRTLNGGHQPIGANDARRASIEERQRQIDLFAANYYRELLLKNPNAAILCSQMPEGNGLMLKGKFNRRVLTETLLRVELEREIRATYKDRVVSHGDIEQEFKHVERIRMLRRARPTHTVMECKQASVPVTQVPPRVSEVKRYLDEALHTNKATPSNDANESQNKAVENNAYWTRKHLLCVGSGIAAVAGLSYYVCKVTLSCSPLNMSGNNK